jgi:hypothetical protein
LEVSWVGAASEQDVAPRRGAKEMLVRALVALLLSASTAQERRLLVPEWAGEARCSVGTNNTSIARPASGLTVLCDGKREEISCSFERAEPIDLAKGEACNLAGLPIKASVPVRVRSAVPEVATEWLELESDGKLVSLAERLVPIKGEATIQVARTPNRFVRFARPGASPVTVSAEELVSSNPWILPVALPGGELLIQTASTVVMPSKYIVAGAAAREVIREHLVENIQGLVPGAYSLTPTYSSGLSGSNRAFKVASGATSVVSIAPESVGALRVTVSPNACRPGDALMLSSVQPGDTMESTLVRPIGQVPLSECVVLLDGLQPGTYRISLRSNGNTLVWKDVKIYVQQVVELLLDVETVMVTGRVTLNGKPFAGVTLQFAHLPEVAGGTISRDPNPVSAEGVKTTTDSSGSYMTFLGAAGSYGVSAKWGSTHILGQDREFKVRSDAGQAVFDMALTGGFLEFHVANWDGRTAVVIELRRTDEPINAVGGASITGVTYSLNPGATLPLRIPGVSFGEYVVNARQLGEPTKVAPRQQVVLAADHANRRVDLALEEQRSTLRVVDDTGRHLDATVTGGIARKIGPGEFDLSKVAPGAKIHIKAPGFVPACRTVGTQGELHVELSRGRIARVDYLEAGTMNGPDGFFQLPGSDCPVNVFYFESKRVLDGPPGASSFIFSNFPMRGAVITPSGARVEIPPAGVMSLRWK